MPMKRLILLTFISSLPVLGYGQEYLRIPFNDNAALFPATFPEQPQPHSAIGQVQQRKMSIEQQNRKVMKMMNPHVALPPTEEEIQAALKKQVAGQAPELNRQQKQHEEVKRQIAFLNQTAYVRKELEKVKYYQSHPYTSSMERYEKAFQGLQQMLEGAQPLSLRDAFYQMENAYGNLHLSHSEYNNILNESIDFIKQFILQNGKHLDDQEALHWGIQKFLGDTTRIRLDKANDIRQFGRYKTHYPFFYDYTDNRAEEDFRNYFVTKTLATGTGQCHTLPETYLLLAEGIGAEAYLTYAPQHSFIKYHNNRGELVNYEPTVDWHFTDQDYMKEMPVMASAIQNGVYLDTLNKKQMIASVMVELAHGYYRQNWVSDGTFINKCVDYAAKHLKHPHSNIIAPILKNDVNAATFDRLYQQQQVSSLGELEKHPTVLAAFRKYQASDQRIKALGYQNFPEEKYLKMLEKHDRRKVLQQSKHIDTKTKKNRFTNH